jgi:hypothetical protein
MILGRIQVVRPGVPMVRRFCLLAMILSSRMSIQMSVLPEYREVSTLSVMSSRPLWLRESHRISHRHIPQNFSQVNLHNPLWTSLLAPRHPDGKCREPEGRPSPLPL